MTTLQVSVDNNSFDRAGITKDCQEAVCEYVWNGFEAGATKVTVDIVGENLVDPFQISISDNGSGICYHTIRSTFGSFLSSTKIAANIRIKSQINKGKGRFSYLALSNNAIWETVYNDVEVNKKYTIQLNSSEKAAVSISEPIDSAESLCGTVVTIPIIDRKLLNQISHDQIHDKLLAEFAWYLYLNKDRNVMLVYEGVTIDYCEYINNNLSETYNINISNYPFVVDIIVWRNRVDNCSKIYYMDSNGEIKQAENTSFNKNAVDFYHAAFVRSSFFVHDFPIIIGEDEETLSDIEPNQRKTMRDLQKHIRTFVNQALRQFLMLKADTYLANMQKKNNYPRFSNDDYGAARKRDFERVTKELYCTEPHIFYKLKDRQVKSLLGFLSLLLDSEERENVLGVIEQVTALSKEQREKLAKVLMRSKLSTIIDIIDIIQQRYEVVKQLKLIVYDNSQYANEREHIQRIIENHYWLFGDQYQLVTADTTMKKSLARFEHLLSSDDDKSSAISLEEQKQRMDIFLYAGRMTEIGEKECLVVELKAPSVPLTIDVYNQIERYANIVRKEPKFQSKDRKWRFFAVCTTVDDDVKVKYENFLSKGQKCLAGIIANFEIYALSWDDIFTSFELRHRFILEKLRQDYECSDTDKDVEPSRDLVNRKVQQLVEMKLA